jgi:hypothetical protein
MFLLVFNVSAQSVKTDFPVLQIKVSINRPQASLFELLNEIQENYPVNFSYTDDMISLDHKVTVKADSQSLYKILNAIFEKTSIEFQVVGKQIVLAKSEEPNSDKPPGFLSDQPKDSLVSVSKKTQASSKIKVKNMRNIKEWEKRNKNQKRIRNSALRYNYKKTSTDTTANYSDTLTNSRQEKPSKNKFKNFFILKNTKDKKLFSLNFNFIAGPSYRKLIANGPEGEEIINQRKQESYKIGFNSEIAFTYYFCRFLNISSGLGILNAGEKGNFVPVPVNNIFSGQSNTNNENFKYSNNYNFLTVPFAIGFKAGSGNFSLNIMPGLVPSVLLNGGKGNLEYYNYEYYQKYINTNWWMQQDMKVPEKVSYRKYNLAYSFRIEGGYRKGKITITAGLSYLRFLYSVYKNSAPLEEKIFLPGIYLGLKFYF